MKKIFTFLFALALVGGAEAQSKLSPSSMLQLRHKTNVLKKQSHRAGSLQDEKVECFIQVNAPCTAELEAMGVKTQAVLGNIMTAEVPLGALDKVTALEQVTMVEVGQPVYKNSDVARANTFVDKVLYDGVNNGLPKNYNGEGVIIGVIDFGVDFRHPALRNADGSSKCSMVYMPDRKWVEGQGGSMVTKEKYGMDLPGVIYTEKTDLDSLTYDKVDESHGTHTASTAAGRDIDFYGGVAPGAELIVAAQGNHLNSTEICNSMAIMVNYAKKKGKRLVITKSIGTTAGPHDASTAYGKSHKAVSEEGAVICQSAGNAGDVNCYIHVTPDSLKTINIDGKDRKYWAMIASPWNSSASQKRELIIDAQLCSRTSTPVDMAVISYSVKNGLQVEVFDTQKGTKFVKNEDYLNEKGAFDIVFRYYNDSLFVIGGVNQETQKYEMVATWCLTTNNDGDYFNHATLLGLMIFPRDEKQEFDMWVGDINGAPLMAHHATNNPNGIKLMSGNSTISANEESSSPEVISVGNYVSKRTYQTLDDKMHTLNLPSVNSIAPSSSYGTTLNGVVTPTVCGPGSTMIAAVSHYDSYYNNIENSSMEKKVGDTNYYWGQMSGTSMSTPHVAGIVALWLQANPKLTRDDIVKVMKETSTPWTGDAYYKPQWGLTGRINALEGMKYVLKTLDIRDLEAEKALDVKGNVYDMKGQMVRRGVSDAEGVAGLPAGIYIMNGRKIVLK